MDTLLAAARAIHIGSCLILSSIFSMLLLVVIPAYGKAWPAERILRQRCRRGAAICLLIAFGSGFLWLSLAIAGMNGSSLREALQPGLFGMVLSQTTPGRVWCVRAALGVLLAQPGGAAHGSRWWFLWKALLATVFAASLAFLGHAGASEENYFLLGGDLVHLVAASLWPASLVPFVILLRSLLKSGDHTVACLITRRFSNMSVAAVAALSLSGLSNSWYLVGSWARLFGTTYGKLLLVKLAIFAVMLAFGACNRLKHQPQLAETTLASEAGLRRIERNVWLEILAGSAILLVAGLMGAAPPADYPG